MLETTSSVECVSAFVCVSRSHDVDSVREARVSVRRTERLLDIASTVALNDTVGLIAVRDVSAEADPVIHSVGLRVWVAGENDKETGGVAFFEARASVLVADVTVTVLMGGVCDARETVPLGEADEVGDGEPGELLAEGDGDRVPGERDGDELCEGDSVSGDIVSVSSNARVFVRCKVRVRLAMRVREYSCVAVRDCLVFVIESDCCSVLVSRVRDLDWVFSCVVLLLSVSISVIVSYEAEEENEAEKPSPERDADSDRISRDSEELDEIDLD